MMKINNNCLFNLLPVELAVDIFSRLPVDSVSQCKLVCKTWRDHLITDHQYNNSIVEQEGGFLLRQPYHAERRFYYAEYDEKVPCFNITRKTIFNNHQYPFENGFIVGSCNGLICLCHNLHSHDDMYVCNPYTGEYAQLPNLNYHPRFNIVKVNRAYGFGYHPITKVYKVVRMCYYHLRGRIVKPSSTLAHVQVYTLGSGTCTSSSWRSIGEIEHTNWNESENNSLGIILDGVLYWLTETNELITSFDLANENFRHIPTPSLVLIGSLSSVLGVLSECLCMSTNVGIIMHIWVMNMKDYSWSKKFDISRMDNYRNYYINNYLPVAHLKSGKILLHCNFYEFVSYDPETEHIVEIKWKMDRSIGFDIIPYTKSSVSLKALGEKEAI